MAAFLQTALCLIVGLVMSAAAVAQTPTPASQQALPILFSADELTQDRELDVVTARGNVEATYGDRTLLADSLTYNQRTNILAASGNVSILEPTGEVLFASHIEISGDMREGIVEELRFLMSDGTRIAAAGGRRTNGDFLDMRQAVYSPCDLCPENPTRPPLWQVKAVRIVHDGRQKNIEYTDAWLEIAGIPVAYTPYFSHPDPTVKRRSGFLAPSIGSSSQLGTTLEVPYFWAIDDSRDITFRPMYASEEGPVLATEYRDRLEAGRIDLVSSLAYDSSDAIRGHVLGKGRFDIDDTWRWGFDAERATDDTYMRRFGFGSKSTLSSRAFAEGFRQRNYVAANAYAFQGLRAANASGTAPYVLPMVDYNHVGEPDRFGGRAELDAGVLALTRPEGTDTRRLAMRGGWRAPFEGPIGDLYRFSVGLRGEAYQTDDLVRSSSRTPSNEFDGRVIPEASLDWRLPSVRDGGSFYQVVEPIGLVAVSPYGGNPDTIPNEDSLDFELDETNVFRQNRFTGLDRVEGGPRLGYGMSWAAIGNGGGSTSALIGQSFRPKTDDTFAQRTGMEDNFSDVVGRVIVSPDPNLDFLYRARWDKDNFAIRRNEIRMHAGPPVLRVDIGYAFFGFPMESGFAPREEAQTSVAAQLTRYWAFRASAIRDLNDDSGGMRAATLDLTYEDECFIISIIGARTFYTDREIQPADTIFLRFTFKTLGDFQTSVL